MTVKDRPIGVFDSGVGGVSVLKELLKVLPKERFLYFADSANAPYGSKTAKEVERLSLKVAGYLVEEKRVKALIVACNTATSAAVKVLRQTFSVPIVGMEPALKPAVEIAGAGQVLVMATPMTLREVKFRELLSRYGNRAEIISLPCPGLVELIEAGMTIGEQVHYYLEGLFNPIDTSAIDVVVLGCTHYIFIREEIISFFRPGTPVVDGNQGTVRQAKRLLEAKEMLAVEKPLGPRVEWFTSGKEGDLSILHQFLLEPFAKC